MGCAVTAAVVAAGASIVAVRAGAADDRIESVVRPVVDDSADEQGDALRAQRDELESVLRQVASNLNSRVIEIENRELKVETGPSCRSWPATYVVVSYPLGGSSSEQICVVWE